MIDRRTFLAGSAAALATAATSHPRLARAQTPRRGGILRCGNLGEPPTLDAHWTTASITETLTNQMYEGLYTLDDSNQPIPMLAESFPTVSTDQLTYTFKLRQGIKFHNGKEMTSEDVVASLIRWGKQSIYGKDLFGQVADISGTDKSTVVLKLKQKFAVVVLNLGLPNNFAAIYPKEVAEKFAPNVKATEWIGTGPYKLAEWKPDQYIRMVRFDDYKARNEKPNGYGGGKTAYADEIRWIPVPDVATRLAQMETGELDFADDLDPNGYDRLVKSANARPVIARLYYWLVAVLNNKQGLMTNQKLRLAWQAALSMDPIMNTVAGGRKEFYRLDSSLIPAEIAAWHTKMPDLPWNEHNPAKAKKLLQEAGYKGEPIRFMTTQEYKWMYDFALVSKQQLEDVGLKIDLQVMDWATLVNRRNIPKEYDAFTTGIGPAYDPTALNVINCNWPGWTCDEEIQTLKTALAHETDYKKRYAIWEKTTRVFYEKAPVIRYGDLFGMRAASKKLKGLNEKMERVRMYNLWLEA